MGAVMRVDASGLVSAAQRLASAVADVSGGGAHAPLAADPTSIGAADTLTAAGAELSAGLAAHILALIASLEYLMGSAVTFESTDAQNAAALKTLKSVAGSAPVNGMAPPAPPVPPDVRAPLPGAEPLPPEVISAGAHADTGTGDSFITGWTRTGQAARDAADHIRSAVAQLPEVLDGPVSGPAATKHLLTFAAGLQTYADRAHGLVRQAGKHSEQQQQARQAIPKPAVLTNAQNRVTSLYNANIRSGGKFAAPLAQAVADKNDLDQQATTGYDNYTVQTAAAVAGDGNPGDDSTQPDPNTPGAMPGQTPAAQDGLGGTGLPGDPDTGDPLSAQRAGEMSSMLPQVMETMLGSVGGLLGGVLKAPESAIQAGTQALSQGLQGLQGLAKGGEPKLDTPSEGVPGGGDPSGTGGGGGPDPTVPASGGGAPDLGVAPSTGAPPTPAIEPAGAIPAATPTSAPSGGMTPMGMPMGGMGGLGGAPGGGGGGGGKSDAKHDRKIQTRGVPHTEDVTGRADINRLSAAAAANRRGDTASPPDNDDPPPSSPPVVRRLVSRRPQEDS